MLPEIYLKHKDTGETENIREEKDRAGPQEQRKADINVQFHIR